MKQRTTIQQARRSVSFPRLIHSFESSYVDFLKSTKTVKQTQERKLLEILRANSQSEFGRSHKFSNIESVKDYQASVPLSDYEDYHEYIERMCSDGVATLTKERPIILQKTSGSSSASKLIPYTASLKNEFLAGIAPWLYSTAKNYPEFLSGKHYWSITPVATKRQVTRSKIRIGFEDDVFYLSSELDTSFLAVPAEVALVEDAKAFRYLTQLFLLKERNLRFISVWNASILEVLFSDLRDNIASIIADLDCGKIRRDLKISATLRKSLDLKLGLQKEAAGELRAIVSVPQENLLAVLFDKVSLISCWTEGSASQSLEFVRTAFPKAQIQGKGILATECFISIPVSSLPGRWPVLAVRSHFFEFLELDDDLMESGRVFLAHELKTGRFYSLAVTTSGGLYRYRMHDIVSVKGFYNDAPMLQFAGRDNSVSDLTGEKLNEAHVARVLALACKKFKLSTTFAMLAPERRQNKFFYTLFLEVKEKVPPGFLSAVELGLRKNFHYDYCLKLGQLAPLRLFRIKDGNKAYLEEMSKRQRLGDIKKTALSKDIGWSNIFKGEFI